jgi:hypothetical protein
MLKPEVKIQDGGLQTGIDTNTFISQLVFKTASLGSLSQKMWSSRWNFHSISSGGRDKSTSGLVAAILDFRLPGTSNGIDNSSLGKRVFRNVGVAVGFSILLAIQAEIQQLLFPVSKLPYWIPG